MKSAQPAGKRKTSETSAPSPRRQLLVHLESETVKRTKKAGIDLDRSTSDIVEEALRDWLQNFDKNPTGK
jgi:hypothetical protein